MADWASIHLCCSGCGVTDVQLDKDLKVDVDTKGEHRFINVWYECCNCGVRDYVHFYESKGERTSTVFVE